MDKKITVSTPLWVTASQEGSCLGGRNVRRKLLLDNLCAIVDRKTGSADLRKYRGCCETDSRGEMGSVWMECSFPYRATIWTRLFMRFELAKHCKEN